MVFTRAEFPNIAPHIEDAQTKLGKPRTLHRTTDPSRIRKNRREACSGFTGPGSCDEYPFASSYEGGKGASVRGVPLTEQNKQGGHLKAFYDKHNVGDKDAFHVDAH